MALCLPASSDAADFFRAQRFQTVHAFSFQRPSDTSSGRLFFFSASQYLPSVRQEFLSRPLQENKGEPPDLERSPASESEDHGTAERPLKFFRWS